MCIDIFFTTENNNRINAIDLNMTGEMLASGGKDLNLRVYDTQTKQVGPWQMLTAIRSVLMVRTNRWHYCLVRGRVDFVPGCFRWLVLRHLKYYKLWDFLTSCCHVLSSN